MKRNFKKILIFTLIASMVLVPLASAVITLASSNLTVMSNYAKLYAVAPNTQGAHAFSFEVNEQGYLASADFYLTKTGTPDIVIGARLVNSSDGTLTGACDWTEVYAESTNNISSTDITSSYVWYSFEFNSTYEIHVTDIFYMVIYVIDYNSGDASNYVRVAFSGTGATGSMRYSDGSDSWAFGSTNDFLYKVWVSDTLSATPTPTPTATSAPGGGDADMEALVAAILPWLVPLLICLIPALLGYKFVGELGFFIGLNVGCILAYVTLAGTAYAFPLWGIILVGVMDVAVVLMRR